MKKAARSASSKLKCAAGKFADLVGDPRLSAMPPNLLNPIKVLASSTQSFQITLDTITDVGTHDQYDTTRIKEDKC